MAADIAAQIAAVRAELETRPEGLIRHVNRVLIEALDLARRWHLDPERVELATWGHDLFRSHPPGEQLALAAEVGLKVCPEEAVQPVLLHGPIAAVVLRERFGVTDDEALAAVRDHTLGAAEMPMIGKVILLADKFEERKRKRTPVMKRIRLAARQDLDLALLCWADWKWVEERTNGWQAHPMHWASRERWVAAHHADVRPTLTRSSGDAQDLADLQVGTLRVDGGVGRD